MQFTSPTEIVKKGAKAFTTTEELVILKNNNFMGLYLPGKLGKALLDSGAIQQMREELWELQDKETVEVISDYRLNGLGEESIGFDDFMKKYDV